MKTLLRALLLMLAVLLPATADAQSPLSSDPTVVHARVMVMNGKFDTALGPVDGFDQDEGSGECDEGAEVCGGLFAAQGDAFEAFDLNGMTDNGLN